jgi:hypothetical protein
MAKKWLKRLGIALPIAAMFVLVSGVHVLAAGGVDPWLAYQKALYYMLQGLIEYFKWIVELFKVA